MFNQLKEKIANYIDTRIKLYQYDLTDKVVKIYVKTITIFIMIMTLFAAIFFVSIALSMILNNYFESYFLGYLVTALLYILCFLFILLTRRGIFWERLKDKIVDKLIE